MIRIAIKTVLFSALAVSGALLLFFGVNFLISNTTAGRIKVDPTDIPVLDMGVVPGAGDSVNNLYFKGRVDAAARLYSAGRVHSLVLVGLSDGHLYHEPESLAQALILRQVPPSALILDTNARRTFPTVLRVRELAGGKTVVFISQRRHLERILFIARSTGLPAYGLAADEDLPYQHPHYHRLREYFARLRCAWDCLSFVFSG